MFQSKSQEQDSIPKYWETKGVFTFLINQSAFDNWLAGGDNNIAGNASIRYNFNYSKNNTSWDTKILASYGLSKGEKTDFEKKTDDQLEINTILGIKAENNWFYSAILNFNTQFTKGYKYSKDEQGNEIRTEYTNFMSPANLSFGIGMLWKKTGKFKVNLAPITTKIVIVDKNFTLPERAYFGVEEGKNTRVELGFNASAYGKLNIMENITTEQSINLYSDYLNKPENVDLDYTLNVVMTINKYMATNLIFQTIYNDNAFKGFQIRQVFGVGINYAI